MENYSRSDMEEALRAIHSTIAKCEKALPKLKEGTSQHTLLVRRIKAFQIAAALIESELAKQQFDVPNHGGYIEEYKRLLKTTNLQIGYQEFVGFFRRLRTCLQKELPDFAFTGSIVENNMDYSYFQFTNEVLKREGLKIAVVFVHADFEHQIWLSGLNRTIQTKYQTAIRDMESARFLSVEELSGYPFPLTLTDDPTKTDYIIKAKLIGDPDYGHPDGMIPTVKENTLAFVDQCRKLLALAKRSQL